MEENEKVDVRSMSSEESLMLRKAAIKLITSGMTKTDVASKLGLRYASLVAWHKAFKEHGVEGLKEAKRGVSKGTNKKLEKEQEAEIVSKIEGTMPDQLDLPFGLWTRKAVGELIYKSFNVELTPRAVGNYLKTWKFTPQKPARVAYEQRPEEVREWLEEQYPSIAARAKAEGAEIHFGDEVGVRNNCQHGRSYARKGRTPVRASMSKKFSINMISTVTAQGKVSFMIYDGRMNADVFIHFMTQLLKWKRRKVFLIVDNLKVHHARTVKAWVSENSEKIELFYLPSYSPQHNPDEYLNCDLKQGISSKRAPKNEGQLKGLVIDHMKMLQADPRRVKSYYRHSKIAYAA